MKKERFNIELSKKEIHRQEKRIKRLLEDRNKPNTLLPLPNPRNEIFYYGMPLPYGESASVKKLNRH
ncbi:hypothetical protein GCM10008967_28310 [Bacillus carboniphilus]|uniref:Uncharacterized protein n=1 Tax=Bacillus carboniphilus TaxID=86663 RepID=A0ABN0WFY3_9BACI